MSKRFYQYITGSIRNQLMLGIALVHAVMMSIFIVDLVERQRHFLSHQAQEQTIALAETLAANSTSWVLARDIVGLDEVLQANESYPDLEYAMVLTPQSEIIGHTDESKRGLYPVDDISRRLLKSAPETQILVADQHLIDVAYPILIDKELIGWARVGINQQKISTGLWAITRDGLLYTLVAIIIGSFFAYWMARGLTHGLARLVAVADGTRAGRRDLRANLNRHDEVGHLATGIDQMLDTLVQNEKALSSSKKQLQKVTDILPAPVTRLNNEGIYLFANAAYQRWFGKKPEKVIGLSQQDCLPPELYKRVSPYFKKAFEGQRVSFDMSILTPDGSPLQAQIHAFPDFDEKGEVQGVFLVSQDLTERKRMEQETNQLKEQLAQATKMEAMGHLTAGIAHDFNNILGAMIGYTDLAREGIINQVDSKKIENHLQQVLNASERARELIMQMLAFGRHQKNAEEQPVILLEPICKEVVTLLRSSLPSSIKINFEMENSDLKTRIQTVQLHQILLNLGVNARDAIGEYGQINIRISTVQIEHQACDACHKTFTGEYIRLSVQDSGSGIDEATMDKIFDPFFTTKEVGKGTGMGLAVVHGLVHTAGGHLLVDTQLNEGTVIHILLPKEVVSEKDENEALNKVHIADNSLSGWHIMVVDDEDIVATMLKEFLSLQGASVQAFRSSEKALQTFAKNPQAIDMVITDETMPGLLGMHMAEQMISLKPGVPIILCTGYSEQATSESAQELGIAGYFRKPVKTRELLLKILEQQETVFELREKGA